MANTMIPTKEVTQVRGWIQRMNWKMQKWMQGRYGQDELYVCLSVIALVSILLSGVSPVFTILAFVSIFFAMFRCYSKNLEKRRQERNTYLKLISKPKRILALQKQKWRDRKTHRYFKCSGCGQVMRVPRGKGKITMTCPKCRKTHMHKT